MSDFKYDQYGNQYVKVSGGGGEGCLLLIAISAVISVVSAIIAWLHALFIQIGKAANWIYNPPFVKEIPQSIGEAVFAWYWLVFFKPLSLILHFFAVVFDGVGYILNASQNLVMWVWKWGAMATAYPNLNLLFSLALEIGVILLICDLIYIAKKGCEAVAETVENLWSKNEIVIEQIGIGLGAIGKIYLYFLTIPLLILLGESICGWLFATS